MAYAVRFEGVTKRYLRGGPRYASLRHDLAQGARRFGQRLSGHRPEPRGTLALDDVSFEVEEGESFAIIGPNGAGKTTALKLVSRISYPSQGRVRVRGRVGALIEVGSGVHPELTARENIWLYGQILGMSKTDVRRRFDQIVDFAELPHVLDTPVKMYSSGMQLRLGFAIASHLDPDVFVVDEALAVGDAGFQAKCIERMTKLVAEGRTLLFVSHNLYIVEAICPRALFLVGGSIHRLRDTRSVLHEYFSWLEARRDHANLNQAAPTPGAIGVEEVTCHDEHGTETYTFQTGSSLEVRLHVRADRTTESVHTSVGISDGRLGTLAFCSTLVDGSPLDLVSGRAEISCLLSAIPLLPRVYTIWCAITGRHGAGELFEWQPVRTFNVVHPTDLGQGPSALTHKVLDSPVFICHQWQIQHRDDP